MAPPRPRRMQTRDRLDQTAAYVLLGLMIERATGSTYREYVTEHVFAGAGMTRSGFFRMDVVEPDVAEGVEGIEDESGGVVGWRRNIYSCPPIGGPDGGAHVTVGDLLSFHRAVTEGRLLGPALTLELLSPKARHGARGTGSHLMGFRLRVRDRCRCRRCRALLLEGRRERRSQRHAPPLSDEGHHLRGAGRRRERRVDPGQRHRRGGWECLIQARARARPDVRWRRRPGIGGVCGNVPESVVFSWLRTGALSSNITKGGSPRVRASEFQMFLDVNRPKAAA
jgi:CubicO group peptidase (beta-lactamase class C family)